MIWITILGVIVASGSFLGLWYGLPSGFSSSWYGFFTFVSMNIGFILIPLGAVIEGRNQLNEMRKDRIGRFRIELHSATNVKQEDKP